MGRMFGLRIKKGNCGAALPDEAPAAAIKAAANQR